MQTTVDIKKELTPNIFSILEAIHTFATISKEGITKFVIVTLVTELKLTVHATGLHATITTIITDLNVFESGNLYFKGIQKFILFHDKNCFFLNRIFYKMSILSQTYKTSNKQLML